MNKANLKFKTWIGFNTPRQYVTNLPFTQTQKRRTRPSSQPNKQKPPCPLLSPSFPSIQTIQIETKIQEREHTQETGVCRNMEREWRRMEAWITYVDGIEAVEKLIKWRHHGVGGIAKFTVRLNGVCVAQSDCMWSNFSSPQLPLNSVIDAPWKLGASGGFPSSFLLLPLSLTSAMQSQICTFPPPKRSSELTSVTWSLLFFASCIFKYLYSVYFWRCTSNF